MVLVVAVLSFTVMPLKNHFWFPFSEDLKETFTTIDFQKKGLKNCH